MTDSSPPSTLPLPTSPPAPATPPVTPPASGPPPGAAGVGASPPTAPATQLPVPRSPPVGAVRPPRTGSVRDRGVTRRDSVHATSWDVEGTVKVMGEVDVGTGRVSGVLSVAGPITADTLVCRGTLDVGGPIMVAGTLTTDGGLHGAGPVRAAHASFSGTSRLAGEVVIDGTLTTRGHFAAPSLRAGEFRGDGAVHVPGTIEAATVEVRIRRDSRFGTILAHSVRLTRSAPNPIETLFGRSPPSPVARIEADRVELEGVDVAFVRCPEVVLGREAHVTELEGTIVRRHSAALVGPRSKSPRPYGLSR